VEVKIDWNEEGEEVFIEKLNGDSVKIKKKIIIKSGKDGKHKIKSKGGTYIISEDIRVDFDDDFDDEHIIIKEIENSDDSVEVIVKKIKKGKKGKKVFITTDGDYTWNINDDEDIVVTGEDVKHNKVKLEILDIDEQGLKILKLKEGFKEFKVKDFDVFVKENKIKFEFKSPQNGALSVKIVDDKGNVVLKDSKKKFDGVYKNELDAKSGIYYIHISQGKKHHIKRLIFERNK
jgi:hypothetical protein